MENFICRKEYSVLETINGIISYFKESKKNQDLAIMNHLQTLPSDVSSLGQCFGAIDFAFKYISSGNENLRKVAAEALCELLRMAVEYLVKLPKDKRFEDLFKKLFATVKILKNLSDSGNFGQNTILQSNINETFRIVKDFFSENLEQDKFVKTE